MKAYIVSAAALAVSLFLLIPLLDSNNDVLIDYYIPRQCYTQSKAPTKQSSYASYASYAIVTMISTAPYTELAATLGKSLLLYSRLPCDVDRIAMVIEGAQLGARLDHEHLQSLRDVGWEVLHMPALTAPSLSASSVRHQRYLPLLSKLWVFNMTSYSGVLFLDADMIVLGNIYDLLTVQLRDMQREGVRLGWARDQPVKRNQFNTSDFNSGALLVRPSASLFDRLLRAATQESYDATWGDQSFLNYYVREHHEGFHELSQRYNCMTPVVQENATLFQQIRDDIRVFHFTYFKPNARFFYLRCNFHGTQRFCAAWLSLRQLHIPPIRVRGLV
jgi:hypothetical protein